MHPAAFDYHRPEKLSDALDLLSRLEDARPLAGGQSLLPVMKLRMAAPAALVDLGRISELRGIRREGDRLVLGAMTRYADVMRSGEVAEACPVLQECVGVIGDVQVRNVGTVGGSVAHMDPASDLPTLLVALEAEIAVAGRGGERTVAAADFLRGLFTTDLREGEIVTAIRIPTTPSGSGAAYVKHPHPASRYAVVGVAAALRTEGGSVEEARLVVGGVNGGPVLVEEAGRTLAGRAPDEDAIREAAATVADALDAPMDDTYASGEYRVHLAGVLARRALKTAAERAGSGAGGSTP